MERWRDGEMGREASSSSLVLLLVLESDTGKLSPDFMEFA